MPINIPPFPLFLWGLRCRCLVCTNGKVAIPCPQSSGYFPKSLLSIQVSYSLPFVTFPPPLLFLNNSNIKLIKHPNLQGKCCAIVDWCICQCHIYMARGLLALSLHLFSRSERSSTFNLIVTSIGTRLETLVQR